MAKVIIRGGINIYPEEIEAVLMAHPAITDAAVIGVPDPARGEEVVAFVVLCGPAGETALRAWCRERLAPYKQPRVDCRAVANFRAGCYCLIRARLFCIF